MILTVPRSGFQLAVGVWHIDGGGEAQAVNVVGTLALQALEEHLATGRLLRDVQQEPVFAAQPEDTTVSISWVPPSVPDSCAAAARDQSAALVGRVGMCHSCGSCLLASSTSIELDVKALRAQP